MADYLLKTSNAPGWEISLYLRVEEISRNDIQNTSVIQLGLYIYSKYDIGPWGDYYGSYLGVDTSNTFNGAIANGTGTRWLISGQRFTIWHNADGSKTQPIYWKWGVNSSWGGFVYPSGTYNYACAATDRSAPSVSFSYSNVTSTSFNFSTSANVGTDWAQYSLNNGATWVDCYGSGTISGLSPNTTYNVKFRLRKTSNQVWGTTGAQAIKTLGASIINSANTITADGSTVNIGMGVTVYDGAYYHKLSVKNGSTVIFTTAAINWSAGTANRTITLTTAQRTALLAAMSTVKSFNATLQLTTYSNSSCSTQIGSVSTKTASVITSADNSAPDFTGFTYVDNSTYAVYLTGNNQYLLKDYSQLVISCIAATAKNGASISSYSAIIGSNSKESSSTTISLGAVNSYGTLICTVTVKDSRGYTASYSKNIVVLNYSAPKITSYTLRRENDIDDNIQLSFNGSLSKVVIDDSNHNSLYVARYRYKRTSSNTWGSYISILPSVSQPSSGTSFSFNSTELVSLDTNDSWDFHIQIQDQCRAGSVFNEYAVIGPGTPHVSIRKKKVGINNKNPQHALDVNGDIAMNGSLVLGFVKTLEGEAFNSLKSGGIYFYGVSTASSNAPVASAGFLEVITDGNNVVQRYTAIASGCALYIRSYIGASNTWTAWTLK